MCCQVIVVFGASCKKEVVTSNWFEGVRRTLRPKIEPQKPLGQPLKAPQNIEHILDDRHAILKSYEITNEGFQIKTYDQKIPRGFRFCDLVDSQGRYSSKALVDRYRNKCQCV